MKNIFKKIRAFDFDEFHWKHIDDLWYRTVSFVMCMAGMASVFYIMCVFAARSSTPLHPVAQSHAYHCDCPRP